MAELIQMIATLSDLRMRRDQFEESKRQFNTKMGFDTKSKTTTDFWKAFESLSGATGATKAAFRGAAQTAGIPPETIDPLEQMLIGMPTSAQTQTEAAMQTGLSSMSPELRRRVEEETASTRLSGMNLGGVAGSKLQERVGSLSGQLLDQTPGAATRALQGMTPLQQQSAVGALPGWAAFQNVDLGRGQLAGQRAQIDSQAATEAAKLAAQLNSWKAMGMLTPDQKTQAVGQMRQLIESMTKKGKNDATRMYDMVLYNSLAEAVGIEKMTDPDKAPQAAGLLERFLQTIMPPQATTTPPSGFNYNYPPQGPMQNPMATVPQNPLDLLYPGRP